MGRLPTLEANIDDVQPVHRLPPEIVSTILTALQPRRRSRYKIPFEVAMSHVCVRWRDIALGTPLLWTNIDIYSIDSLDCVSSYLARSQNCPVDVRLDIWQSDRLLTPEAGATILPLVDLTIQHIARWRTLLVFTSHKSTTTSILLKMADLAAPLLQRIRIVDDGEDEVADTTDQLEVLFTNPRIFTGGVPSLGSVQIDGLNYLPPLSNVTTLYLHTFSHFSSSEINTGILFDLTIACPSLCTLSVHGNFQGVWSGNKITMPSIRSLWFQSNAPDNTLAAKFLTTVSLPNLEALWLHCPLTRVVQVVAAYPTPTFPALKYLTLQSFDFYASSLFAKAFPTIRALHFAYCKLPLVMFLKETLIENEYSRWPNLDTLVFRTTRETPAKKISETLDEMVTERHKGNHPIQKILVDKDILATLSPHADSLREKTTLELLRPDNFDDPWWVMSHMDTGDRL